MSTLQFYLEQAAQCRNDAARATLGNVKERSERAAQAWDSMAHRLTRTIEQRELNESAKAAALPASVARD